MDRQNEGKSLSIQHDATNQPSQNFTDDTGRCADNTSKTTTAAAAASDLAEDRDVDDDDDLSYDEQDSVGELSGQY